MSLTFGRDAVFPWKRATECHHLRYGRSFKRELPIFDIIPLSHGTHEVADFLRKKPIIGPIANLFFRLCFLTWVLLESLAIYGILVLLRVIRPFDFTHLYRHIAHLFHGIHIF